MSRALWLFLTLSAAAHAQTRPTLIDAPLDVRVSMPAAKSQALQTEFRQLLVRKSGTLVPTQSDWKAAVSALRRQDCDVRDECLRQLAVNGGSLYALYASLERDAAGLEYTASGRVVNQDGALTRGPVTVKVPAKEKDAASRALANLLTELKLSTLPATLEKPVAPVVEVPRPVSEPPVVVREPPPPLPPLLVSAPVVDSAPTPGARVVAFITLGLGLAAGGTAIGFGVSAAAQRGQLPLDGRFTDAQATQQQRVNQFATISLASGIGAGVMLATSLVLFGVSGPSPKVALIPSVGPNGLSASLAWRLP